MLVGQMQDSVIGGYLLTRDQVAMDDIFMARVHSNSSIRFDMFKYSKNEQQSGRQVLSAILPYISYQGKSELCKNTELAKRVTFTDTDKNIVIELGELKSGYFDKGAGDVQTMIALLYEPKHAMDTIFSIQQAILNYNKYAGFSIGFRDILLSKKSHEMIRQKNDEMMKKGFVLMDQYTKNVLNEPIGKSRWEYLQDSLKHAFYDEGLDVILSSAGVDANGLPSDVSTGISNALAMMVVTGSKGSFGNTKTMLVRIGQALNDNRPLPFLFDSRLNGFFKKNDMDPRSHGMIMDSYLQGLTPSQLISNCIPERTQMLNKVLTVAKPGFLGKKMIKNLEPILVNNVRMCLKYRAITEMLFGHDGFAIQSLCKFRIPYFGDSSADFITKMCDRVHQPSARLSVLMKEHAKAICQQVYMYKYYSVWLQKVNSTHYVKDEILIPVMLEGIIKTREHQAGLSKKQLSDQQYVDIFTRNAQLLNDFLSKLSSLYFNARFTPKEGTKLPRYYSAAVNALKLGLLCCFGVDRLVKFLPEQLELALEDIALEIKHGMLEPGTPIGVQVGQAMQEYFTYDMLDSIHKTASGEVTRDPLDRIIDIFNNKSPQNLQQAEKILPFMRIPLIPGFEGATLKQSKERAEQIASNIKLIRLTAITSSWQMLNGLIEQSTDASLVEDKDFVQSHPERASYWCLRVVLDRMKMFLNRISVNEVKYALEQRFQVHVIASGEYSRIPVVRIYLQSNIVFQSRSELRDIVDGFLEYAVRGIPDILSASVIEETKQQLTESGALRQITQVVIIAEGFNLREIYRLQHKYYDIDYNCITSDNQYQTMQHMGLGAARQKIINEINILFEGKVNQKHVEFVAAEMTQTGALSNIEQNGIRVRNPNNELLAMCDQRPISAIRRAAIGGKTSQLEGCSASMVVGQTPKFGTTYNSLVLNELFVAQHSAV